MLLQLLPTLLFYFVGCYGINYVDCVPIHPILEINHISLVRDNRHVWICIHIVHQIVSTMYVSLVIRMKIVWIVMLQCVQELMQLLDAVVVVGDNPDVDFVQGYDITYVDEQPIVLIVDSVYNCMVHVCDHVDFGRFEVE